MNVPILSKRRSAYRERIQYEANERALNAVTKAASEFGPVGKGFLTGNAALGNSGGGMTPGATLGGRMPDSSWSNQSALTRSLIARTQQNLASNFDGAGPELENALAAQGLSWGPPFPPGRPLDPFWGYKRPPRTWDFQVGENVQLTPRWNRINFGTLKAIYEAYDVAQICVRHLINDVRSLEYNWGPPKNCKDDVGEDIQAAEEFWEFPDKRQSFRHWLAEYLQDILRYDAGALYSRKTEAGDPHALEVISGETIIPLIDFYGRRPEDSEDEGNDLSEGNITPAYLQIVEGLPWDWLAADEVIYQPWNPMPESQYGLAPLEAVLLSANTDIRFQWHFLQFFTEGSIPAGFMEAPPDLSDPAQIADWQQAWDALMLGDQSKLRQIRWVPNGAKFTEAKPSSNKFDEMFPLYLMRRTCAAFGVTPNDLGFTESVNRATGDTQIDVQFRVGTLPLLRHLEDIINLFTTQQLHLRARFKFDDGREVEDRVATAQAHGIYLDHGVESVDEVRDELGLTIDKSRPFPRYINNTRAGPIPALALESMAGEIDPETYGRSDKQQLVSTPYASPPGVLPAQGSPEQLASAATTGQASRDLIAATTGSPPAEPEPEPKAVKGTYDWRTISMLLDVIEKGADNTGGPGVHPAGGTSTTVTGGTDGITVSTGIEGKDFEDDEEEDDDAKKSLEIALSLRRWRENSRNRLRKGKPPRQFVDPDLPQELHDEIWKMLDGATTREQVDGAFTKARDPKAKAGSQPAFHRNADKIVEHYAPLIQQGVAETFTAKVIDDAIKAGNALVQKSAGPPPNLRQATTDLESCKNCCLFAHPVCVKYGNWDVKPDQTCDGWELAIDDQVQKSAADVRTAIEGVLKSAQQRVGKLTEALRALHGDSILQGAHEAAEAAKSASVASLKVSMRSLDESGYWDRWEPGHGPAAAQAVDGGMRDMLDQAGQTIQGLNDTTMDRIGNVIAEGLAKGDSVGTTKQAVNDYLSDPARSERIANTEYARAMDTASVETYEQAGITEEDWLAEADACPECEANADGSPYPVGSGPTVPAHPECRCAKAPHIEGAT